MAITTAAVSVTTAATLLAAVPTGGLGQHGVLIRVVTVPGTVYIGGPSVTSATGIPWSDTDGAFPITTKDSDDGLYAITASGTVAVRVLKDEG